MDAVAKAYFFQSFHIQFLESRGDSFQNFFSSIMEKRYPGDFIRVRPWGNIGDQKNDGYLSSKRILFQCYAPNEMTAKDANDKIDEDFNGALPHWRKYFDTWVFVHNSRQGLNPTITAKLLELKAEHETLQITHWGFEELRNVVAELTQDAMTGLFGFPPTRAGLVGLGLQDLAPVLDQIERLHPLDGGDLRPVPEGKLEYNMLSLNVRYLLTMGMTKVDLVKKYFRSKPDLKDQLAETFKKQYQEIKQSSKSPDQIFSDLQKFAGGSEVPSPGVQNAVLAVLAYFFEECDIFDRPKELGESI